VTGSAVPIWRGIDAEPEFPDQAVACIVDPGAQPGDVGAKSTSGSPPKKFRGLPAIADSFNANASKSVVPSLRA